jgi:hypothetical protein
MPELLRVLGFKVGEQIRPGILAVESVNHRGGYRLKDNALPIARDFEDRTRTDMQRIADSFGQHYLSLG